ncbi:hypothetical protein ACJJTC_017445 [Scirpophaga incertulas]
MNTYVLGTRGDQSFQRAQVVVAACNGTRPALPTETLPRPFRRAVNASAPKYFRDVALRNFTNFYRDPNPRGQAEVLLIDGQSPPHVQSPHQRRSTISLRPTCRARIIAAPPITKWIVVDSKPPPRRREPASHSCQTK